MTCTCGNEVFLEVLFSQPPLYEIKCHKCGLSTGVKKTSQEAENKWEEMTKGDN